MALSTASKRAIILSLVGAAGLVVVTFSVILVGLWGALTSIFQPTPMTAYDVYDPECVVVSPTEILISMTIAPKEPGEYSWAFVQDVSVTGGLFHGSGTLDDFVDLTRLSDAQHADLYAQLYDDHHEVAVGDVPTMTVLRVERTAEQPVTVGGNTLWFAAGEPAFAQHVPLHVDWSYDCSATLG